MTYFKNDPRGLALADGTLATNGNNAAPDALSVFTQSGGSVTFQSKRWMVNGGADQHARFERALGGNRAVARMRLDQTGLAAVSVTADCAVLNFTQAGSSGGGVRLSRLPTGAYRLYNYAGTQVWQSTSTYNGDHELVLRAEIGTGTSDGELHAAIYPGGSNTAAEQYDSSTANAGAVPFDQLRAGKITFAAALPLRIVNVQGDDASFASITSAADTGPIVTASTGGNLTDVEPYSVQTLAAVTNSAGGVWSQVSGPPVTITGSGPIVTYVATGTITAATRVFRFTVGGVSSDVTHTAYPVTERAVVGGVEKPERLAVSAASTGTDPVVVVRDGPMTDREFQSFTDPAGLTSRYHLYAANLPANEPLGLVVHLHGDGAYDFQNPVSSANGSYFLGAMRGLVAQARYRKMITLSALTPDTDNGAAGAGVTWWEEGIPNAAWLRALIDRVRVDYNVDSARIWVVGYSGGSQLTTKFLVPTHSNAFTPDGLRAVVIGGGGPSIDDGPINPFAPDFLSRTRIAWYSGADDDGKNADGTRDTTFPYNAVGDAKIGRAQYVNTFKFPAENMVEDYPAGVTHSLSGKFGGIVAKYLERWDGYSTARTVTGSATRTSTTSMNWTGTVTRAPAVTLRASASALTGQVGFYFTVAPDLTTGAVTVALNTLNATSKYFWQLELASEDPATKYGQIIASGEAPVPDANAPTYTTLPNMVAHLDMAQGVTSAPVTSDVTGETTTRVTQVVDQRTGATYTNSTPTNRPEYVAATASEPAFARFKLSRSLRYSGTVLPSSYTLYAVVRQSALTYGSVFAESSTTSTFPVKALDCAASGQLRSIRRTNDNVEVQSQIPQIANAWRVVSITSSGWAATDLISNEQAATAGTTTATSSGATTTNTVMLGARMSHQETGTAGMHFTGDIAMVVAYSGVHNSATRATVTKELATRCKIVLPSQGGTVNGPESRILADRQARSVAYGIPATHPVTGKALPAFHNTGPALDTVYEIVTGDLTSTADNQVIRGKWVIGGRLLPLHRNVTFEDCIVYSTGDPKADSRQMPADGRFTMRRVELYGTIDDDGTAVGFVRYRAEQCIVHDYEDGFRLNADSVVTGCLAVDQSNGYIDESERLHTDDVQSTGCNNAAGVWSIVQDCTLLGERHNGSKGNSAVILNNEQNYTRRIRITGNYLGNGSYTLDVNSNPFYAEQFEITNNVFRGNGMYGEASLPNSTQDGFVTFTGNVREDGQPLRIHRSDVAVAGERRYDGTNVSPPLPVGS